MLYNFNFRLHFTQCQFRIRFRIPICQSCNLEPLIQIIAEEFKTNRIIAQNWVNVRMMEGWHCISLNIARVEHFQFKELLGANQRQPAKSKPGNSKCWQIDSSTFGLLPTDSESPCIYFPSNGTRQEANIPFPLYLVEQNSESDS
jgi:hypothetical protein